MKARLLPALAALCLPQCAQQAYQAAPTYPASQPPPTPIFAPQPQRLVQLPPPQEAPPQALSPWQQASSVRSRPLNAGAHLHEFTARSAEGAAEVSVIIFDSQQCALKVLDQPDSLAGGGALISVMRQAGAIAGVNGGFFHPDFSTLGLMITAQGQTGQFTRSSLVSGALVVIGQEPYLVWNSEFLGTQGVTQMVQAGPRLVDEGRPLPTLNRTKHATRTFIATDGQRQWAVGTVRSTTLAGLGDLLASDGLLPGMPVLRALNLDGGRSTALYARQADGQEISRPGWSTVRNYVAVVPR
ncbi:phosphodiester glycosidase family protein [Prosthecobacter dejongeii]|uniref:Uncharacterized protein YigE (DUF2233 family) n=1 Tax=Prosthecobacter dejongeii TaxID=48465 RepID=A0A7W7YKA3_9BACT|nr:phosphodiester glycosidase family protein [Prosthecobacter dejongeii]MBB5037751.1 uncharacterized protein YigE (DUF2233 family) [Prosthecobacter dejongeii]